MQRHSGWQRIGLKGGLILIGILVLSGGLGAAQVSAAPEACVAGPHSGVIAADQEWCLADSPHLLSGTVTVAAGARLTIEPGVTVQAGADGNVAIYVLGHLQAVGSQAQPITFTSLTDSGPYEWLGITFSGGTGTLEHTIIRYTGRGCYQCPGLVSAGVAALNVQSGQVSIAASQIITSSGGPNNNAGVYVSSSRVAISDTLFSGIGDDPTQKDYPVYTIGASSDVALSSLVLRNNTYNRVAIQGPTAMTAHNFTLTAQPAMEGYALLTDDYGSSLTIPTGITMTVEPGVILMAPSNGALLIQGRLQAIGTEAQPILFTSTQNTGPNQWLGITFNGGTGALEHAIIRYTGRGCSGCPGTTSAGVAALNVQSGQVSITASQIMTSSGTTNDHGVYVSSSRVAVADTRFSGIGDDSTQAEYPIYITGATSDVALSGLVLHNNSHNQVALQGPTAMTAHNFTLTAQPAMEGYALLTDAYGSSLTIPAGITMTVEPGVILMAPSNGAMLIQGRLQAIGTEAQPILFTSTQNTGPNQWLGITFNGGTGALEHAIIRYTGRGCSGCPGTTSAGVAALNVQSGQVSITASQIMTSSGTTNDHGVYVSSSRVAVADTRFSGIGDDSTQAEYPIYITGATSDVALSGLVLHNNSHNQVALQGPTAMTAHNFTLTAQPVMEGYALLTDAYGSDLTVPAGITMTVEPGVTLMAPASGALLIQGRLQAIGTEAQPILFTSTQNTGPYQWEGIRFVGGTGALEHAIIRYTGRGTAAVTANNVQAGEVSIASSRVISSTGSSSDHGLYVSSSRVLVDDVVFAGIGDAVEDSVIQVRGNSFLLVSDSTIASNKATALLVDDNDALVRVIRSSIIGNGATGSPAGGVRNNGSAVVILGGEPDAGNAIYINDGYGAYQAGTSGRMVATYNWWGSAAGPTHTSNPTGDGEEVSDRVSFTPWLTTPLSSALPSPIFLNVSGPIAISPGDVANLGVTFANPLTETLHDVVVVGMLPEQVSYLDSTGSGQYQLDTHDVAWTLGDVPPGYALTRSVRVQYHWGLPTGLVMTFRAIAGARERSSPILSDLDMVLNYSETEVTYRAELSEAELDAELATDAELAALFQTAQDEGFVYFGNAYAMTLSTGAQVTEIYMLPEDPTLWGQVRVVRRQDGSSIILDLTQESISGHDGTSGFTADLTGGQYSFWGTWNAIQSQLFHSDTAAMECLVDESTCIRNCLVKSLSLEGLSIAVPELGAALAAANCGVCVTSGFSSDPCSACMSSAADALGLKGASVLNSIRQCMWNCHYSQTFRDEQACTTSQRWCSTAQYPLSSLWEPVVRVRECDQTHCTWLMGEVIAQHCGATYGVCIQKPGVEAHCCDTRSDPECPCEKYHMCDPEDQKNRGARDPNALYGPEQVVPGETVTYTVSYENVGDGTAYGVYITGYLPTELDASTLVLTGDAAYFPSTRLMLWSIGPLAAHAGGAVTYRAEVLPSVISGTVILNAAVVTFPSVPETTPTNDLVSVVQLAAAHAQRIQTTEGVPVAVILTGSGPSGSPLSYGLTSQPLNGTLSGTLPNLSYTPAQNFEGGDQFAFWVSDGEHRSLPAYVTIEVQTGSETVAPQILSVWPQPDALDVPAPALPLLPGVYLPRIWAQASEPLDPATVTAGTFILAGPGAQQVAGVVGWSSTLNRIVFVPSQPLSGDTTYTARVTGDVRDSSGNLLAADYVWSFTTMQQTHALYLSLVIRTH